MSFAASHPDLPPSTHAAVSVCLFILFILSILSILSIFIAYASLKLYDLPVREWLRKKWF